MNVKHKKQTNYVTDHSSSQRMKITSKLRLPLKSGALTHSLFLLESTQSFIRFLCIIQRQQPEIPESSALQPGATLRDHVTAIWRYFIYSFNAISILSRF